MKTEARMAGMRSIRAGASLLALLIANQALAQETPSPAAEASAAESPAADAGADQDIVVTGTRRETMLMETPVAITAITAESLERQNITSAAGLERTVPGLKIQDSSTLGMGALQLTMRGIGNSNYTEQGDPNVGLHVDGVYSSRPQAAWNLIFDVDRVEVLRGPQGTLFGRNSTVGSINIITTKPKLGTVEGKAEAQYGRFNDVQLRGAVNIPIGDTLAIRATGFYGKRDSYYDLKLDPTLGTTPQQNPYLRLGDPTDEKHGAGSLDHKAFRLSALWEPIPNGSIYVAWEKYMNNSPAAPLTVPEAKYTAYLNTPNITDMDIDSIRAEAHYEIADAVDVKYTFGRQHYNHDILVDLDAGVSMYRPANAPGTDQQFFWDRPFRTRSRSHEVQLTSTYDSPLQWVAGFFDFREETLRDLWIDLPLVSDGLIDFYQPSRVAASQAVFGTLDYDVSDKFAVKAGARYSRDHKTDEGGSRYDAFPGDGARARFGVPVFLQQAGISDLDYLTGANTGGLQGISRQTGFPGAPGTPNALIAAAAGTTPQVYDRLFFNDAKWHNLDLSLTLSYQPDPDTYLYGTVATGYKSGTFQDTYFQARNYRVYRPILDPEHLTSYELGLKKSFDVGTSGPLNISLAAFFMDYKDKQEAILTDFGDQFCPYTFGDFDGDGYVENFVPGLTNIPIFSQVRYDPATLRNNPSATEIAACGSERFDTPAMQNMTELVPINLASARIGGLELEYAWNPSRRDRINGFITLTPINRITDIDTSQLPFNLSDSLACGDRVGGCPQITSVEGNKLPFAALATFNFSYAHDFELANGGTITAWGQANYSSPYYLTLFNVRCYDSISAGGEVCDNGDYQKSYAVLDMSLRYTSPKRNFYAEAFAYNVTGAAYASFNRRNGNDYVTSYAYNARPTYGLRAGVNF